MFRQDGIDEKAQLMSEYLTTPRLRHHSSVVLVLIVR